MDWKKEYERKLVTPEEAISVIKSGDRVVFAQGMEPFDLGLALAGRLGELKNITISARTPVGILAGMTLAGKSRFLYKSDFHFPL